MISNTEHDRLVAVASETLLRCLPPSTVIKITKKHRSKRVPKIRKGLVFISEMDGLSFYHLYTSEKAFRRKVCRVIRSKYKETKVHLPMFPVYSLRGPVLDKETSNGKQF